MRALHSWKDGSATILVEGLQRPLRVLHITDVHLGLIDERDGEYIAQCQGCEERFLHRHQNVDEHGRPLPARAAYAQILASFADQGLDLIALTGDIVDIPMQASVDYALAQLEATGVPFLYTAGNHDWLYPAEGDGMLDMEALRTMGWPVLEPLHGGAPAGAVRDIGGVRFLSIDNSTYQITAEQLEFTSMSLAAGLPTVILTHIPLSIPTLRPPTIEIMAGSILLADPGWSMEERRESHVGADTPETLAFVRLLAGAENLLAILCGHIHFAHVDSIAPQAVQYVGGPGFAGEYRLLELRPL